MINPILLQQLATKAAPTANRAAGIVATKAKSAVPMAKKLLEIQQMKNLLPRVQQQMGGLASPYADFDMAVDLVRGKVAPMAIDDIAAARNTIMQVAKAQMLPQEIQKYGASGRDQLIKMINLMQKRIRNEGY